MAEELKEPVSIPYAEIPHFPPASVEGHPGQLVLGEWAGKWVGVLRGRVHYYEGVSLQEVTLPVRVLRALGAELLIVTNAAGGLNPEFRAGDLMLITDHINWPGMAGLSPLRGPHDPRLGPRFLPTAHRGHCRPPRGDARVRHLPHQQPRLRQARADPGARTGGRESAPGGPSRGGPRGPQTGGAHRRGVGAALSVVAPREVQPWACLSPSSIKWLF
ncbi:MAG: purine-nucleoside phosphorylase [Chloroflexi bacterium]|nr:purine-nucleoside phosphorylase [Chloroflexota bacterium]